MSAPISSHHEPRADPGPADHAANASVNPSLDGYGEIFPPSAPMPARDREGPPALRVVADYVRATVVAHRLDLLIVGALLAVVALAHGLNMGSSPAFFDDEGTYVSQAWAVTNMGELAPYTYWYDHPPLGWILMAAWSVLIQPFSSGWAIADFRALMLLLTLVDAALIYVIARRLELGRPFAVLAVALFALSPLAVHYQRMVLLDNLSVTWLLAAFALALTPRRQLAAYSAAGLCLAAAVLTKETFLLALPALLLVVWQRSEGPTRAFSMSMFMASFGLTAAFYPLFAMLQGELFAGSGHTSLWDGIQFQLTRPGGGGIADPDSGTRNLIDSWLSDDSFLLPVALVLTPVALAIRRFRAVALALLIPVIIASRPSAYVPAMLVLGLIPFAALIVSGVAESLWRKVKERPRPDASGVVRLQYAAAVPALIALVGGLALVAGPQWAGANLEQMSDDEQAAGRLSVDWIDERVPRDSTLLVDDTVWVDLVERGFAPERTIWFYKLDLDPGVQVDWREVDYVLRSNIMAGNARDLPSVRAALEHSELVALFTDGAERMEVRRVTPTQRAAAP